MRYLLFGTRPPGDLFTLKHIDDEFLEDFEDDAEERECITDWPHLFASDRMGYLREAARSLDNELSAEAEERIERPDCNLLIDIETNIFVHPVLKFEIAPC